MTTKDFGTHIQAITDLKSKDFTKSNNFINSFYKNLNIPEIKLINTLLFMFSTYSKVNKNNEVEKDKISKVFLNDGYFEFKYQDLIKLMNVERNMKTYELEECLENIRKRGLKYVKYDETSSTKICTSFIHKFHLIRENEVYNNEIVKETKIKIFFDRDLFEDIFNYTKIGYTIVSIDINKIKSRMGLGLYEELQRITPLKKIKKITSNDSYSVSDSFKSNHSYTLEEFNEICGTKYQFLSKFIDSLNIQYNKLVKNNLVFDNYKFYIENKKIFIDIVRPQF